MSIKREITLYIATNVVCFAIATLVIATCLLGDSVLTRKSGLLAKTMHEVNAAFLDAQSQWLLITCCGACLISLVWVRGRETKINYKLKPDTQLKLQDGVKNLSEIREWKLGVIGNEPGPWLLGLAGLAVFNYAMNYDSAARSTQALMLLGLATLGHAVAVAAGWETQGIVITKIEKHEDRTKRELNESNYFGGRKVGLSRKTVRHDDRAIGSRKRWTPGGWQGDALRSYVIRALVGLLVCSMLFCREARQGVFNYRGQARLTGWWDNPNAFGLLMAVGTILAIAMAFDDTGKRRSVPNRPEWALWFDKNERPIIGSIFSSLNRSCWLASAGILAVGLLKSYSRGAWVAAAVGLSYLVWNQLDRNRKRELWILRYSGKFKYLLCVVALAMILLWSLSPTEGVLARRAASVVNPNDFSWRNRVVSWEGALQMMAEKPLFGFGWNRPSSIYFQFYAPSSISDRGAFELNDYSTLGAALGIPALFCFVVYVQRVLIREPEWDGTIPRNQIRERVSGACRSGAIALFVGFVFNGGLFNLATAAPFWILLELGRGDCHCR